MNQAERESSVRQRVRRQQEAIEAILGQLQGRGPMLAGSIYTRRRRCGKGECRCVGGRPHEDRVLAVRRAGRDYEEHRLEIQPEQSPALLVICADGGRVQTRTDFAERGAETQEQEDLNPQRWKESEIGVVYDAVARPQQAETYGGYRGAEAKIKTYVATMRSWDDFGWFLRVEAEKRGCAKAKTTLFLADGAPHIRALQRLQFPAATFILDWPHAAEHLFASATAAFGEGTAGTREWHAKHRQMLWEGKVDALISELERLARRAGVARDDEPENSPKKVLHRNAYSYFPNNKDAMAYPVYREKGWPIGSGVVEAAVKQFGIRMKGSEKFWNLGWVERETDGDGMEFDPSQTGAEEMLALRSLYLSEDGRWQRYWEERGRPKKWA